MLTVEYQILWLVDSTPFFVSVLSLYAFIFFISLGDSVNASMYKSRAYNTDTQ